MTYFTLRLELTRKEPFIVFEKINTIEEVYEILQQYREKMCFADIEEITPLRNKKYIYYQRPNLMLYETVDGRIYILLCSSHDEKEKDIINKLIQYLYDLNIEIPSQMIMLKSLMNLYYTKRGSITTLSSIISSNYDYFPVNIEDYTSLKTYIKDLEKILKKQRNTLALLEELTAEWRIKANFTGEDSELVDKKYYYALDEPEISFNENIEE